MAGRATEQETAGRRLSRLQRHSPSGESQIPIGQRRMAEQTRYAVSPIVIAAWESVARELGWPDKPIGWQDIQRQATQILTLSGTTPAPTMPRPARHAGGVLRRGRA